MRIFEWLYERDFGRIAVRIWFAGETPTCSPDVVDKEVKPIVDANVLDGQIAIELANLRGVNAVQVKSIGSPISALVYNDWP